MKTAGDDEAGSLDSSEAESASLPDSEAELALDLQDEAADESDVVESETEELQPPAEETPTDADEDAPVSAEPAAEPGDESIAESNDDGIAEQSADLSEPASSSDETAEDERRQVADAGEVSNQEPPSALEPSASASEPAARSVNLPKALIPSLEALDAALASGDGLFQAVTEVCEAARRSPDSCIGLACERLSSAFASERSVLGRAISPEFLVLELEHGPPLLSPLTVSQWQRDGSQAQLLRFADGILHSGERIRSQSSETAEVLLSLAVCIAIYKPSRSQHLIDLANPGSHADAGRVKALRAEAEVWQEAGQFLLEGGHSHRDFWQRQAWEKPSAEMWQSSEGEEALAYLRDAEAGGRRLPGLFETLVPQEVWRDFWKSKRSKQPKKPAAIAHAAAVSSAEPSRASRREPSNGFMPGFLLGSLTTLVAGSCWLFLAHPEWLESKSAEPASAAKAPAQPAPAPQQLVQQVSTEPPAAPAAVAAAENLPPLKEPPLPKEPPPVSPPAPPSLSPPMPSPPAVSPAPAPPLVAVVEKKEPAVPPAPAAPPSVSPPPPAEPPAAKQPSAQEKWVADEREKILKDYPGLARLAERARSEPWAKTESLISGREAYLPVMSAEYSRFLLLLNLEPPPDKVASRAAAKLAASRIPVTYLAPIWEKLLDPPGENAGDIREAAQVLLDLKGGTMMLEWRERLAKIAR